MADCLIGLGSNMGDRADTLDRAIQLICDAPQVRLRACSRYYETAPVGGPDGQQAFLNAALRVTTLLSPCETLIHLRNTEQKLGRTRLVRWGPRAIDLDLLLYDQQVIDSDQLTVPHPRMAIRRFVLQPACEIAADMIHAPTGWALSRLLSRLDEFPCYVAVAGVDAAARQALAADAAARVQGALLSWNSKAADLDIDPLGTISPQQCGVGLEALSAQAELLTSLATHPVGMGAVLCDFWLPQFLAVAGTWPPGAAREQLEAACRAAMASSPLPRFTVLLDSCGTSDAAPSLSRERLAEELSRQADIPGRGPILRVPAGDTRAALVELTAGIDAMR